MHILSARPLALGALLSSSLVYGGLVQKPGLTLPSGSDQHRDAVVKIFTTSYDAYKQYAFGHDDLLPLSHKSSDSRNGWGASIVDAMSTMQIMGLDAYFTEAVQFASQIDFNKSNTSDPVSVFETTIRYLGGLLSAFELSEGKYPALLDKAKQVADKMSFAWVDGNDVPFGYIDFSSNSPQRKTSNIAEAGTLTLEWSTLSKYTGSDRYRGLAEGSVRRVASQATPLPGLPAQGIDPSKGTPVGGYVTWGGGSDSYFEYLIKYARLNNTADNFFADHWKLAVDSSIKNLYTVSVSDNGDQVYLADYDASSKKTIFVGSHLACFHGGNWLLGGRLTNNQTIVDIGLELADSCWNTYASTATGIGPEAFAYVPKNSAGAAPADQTLFNAQHGFYITSPYYILRPEVLESNFYAWRVTGNIKYFERAVSAVESFNKYLSANGAFAGLYDVNNIMSRKVDDMESFWFAEVLKYLYLTFDDPGHISLDQYVFNTEAHPFKIPPPKDTYGSGGLPTPTSNAPAFHMVDGPMPQVSQSRGLLSFLGGR